MGTTTPTKSPTRIPTLSPTKSPTKSPTLSPTLSPSTSPTLSPTTCSKSASYEEAVTYKNKRMCNQVIDLGPKYDDIYRNKYTTEKTKCTRRRRLRGRGRSRGSRGGSTESCEDKAIRLAKAEVMVHYNDHKNKLLNKDGLSRCMDLVNTEYANPLKGEDNSYDALAYGKGLSGGRYSFLQKMHEIYAAFQVPRDVDSEYKKYADMVGTYSGDWRDYEIYKDGPWIGADKDRDEQPGMNVILEGGLDRNGKKQDTKSVWVSDIDFNKGIFEAVSPCSSGMFHYDQVDNLPERKIKIGDKWHTTFDAMEEQPFCGCCVGPREESHYIFPTPLDLSDSTDTGNGS